MRGVLVTGASRGIGAAVVRAFAEAGDHVAVHYATRGADAAQLVRALPGDGHVAVGGDLTDPDRAREVVDGALAALGEIDVLVNNAGLAPDGENAHDIAEAPYEHWVASWRQMVDVNLLAATNVSWLVARHLIDRGAPGAIVNIGSRGAFRGEPEHPAYGAAKAALHAFGQSIAVALAPHRIAVASVAPGFVATERQRERLSGAGGDAVRAESPFGRVGTPEEVAAAVLHLASPQAVWSSGAILDLNGASYLRS